MAADNITSLKLAMGSGAEAYKVLIGTDNDTNTSSPRVPVVAELIVYPNRLAAIHADTLTALKALTFQKLSYDLVFDSDVDVT